MTVGQVPAAGGAGQESLETAHRALLQDRAIQFDLQPYREPPPPDWLEPVIAFFRWLLQGAPYFFWAMLALLAALILFWVLRNVMGVAIRWPWQKRSADAEPNDSWQPEAGAARHLLEEAEALAARGDYAQAVHLLLHRSVQDIATRRPEFLLPSLTARDIAAAPSLPERAREAFGAMADIVERALFARQPVGEQGWTEARAAYERFAFRDSWRAA